MIKHCSIVGLPDAFPASDFLGNCRIIQLPDDLSLGVGAHVLFRGDTLRVLDVIPQVETFSCVILCEYIEAADEDD